MSLLVVGSVAFDSIETPFGKAERVLGGSATFFMYAASYFTKQRLVGIVGADFPREALAELQERGVDISGLTVDRNGKTFHWTGKYEGDMNSAQTLGVSLNVLGTYKASVKIAGKPAFSEDVKVVAGQTWGLLIGPGGILPVQVY